MNGAISERLAAPRNFRLKRKQTGALAFLSEANDDLPIQYFVRRFVEIGIKLCKANGNQLPQVEQARLQRALTHRARRDAKRSKQ